VELSPPVLVQTPAAWQACLAELLQQDRLAVDTESNSLHAYREQVCLIQVSIPGRDFIIDPLSLPHLDGLGELMADSAVEKTFHAAEYDILCLKRDYGYSFANLFDTMVAARILGWKQIGLGSILQQEFGVHLNKRFQRANWGRRPLTPEQINYARKDTCYLAALRDRLAHQLQDAGRMIEARGNFAQLAEVTSVPRVFSPDNFWQLLNGRYQLTPQQHAVLRELYIFREQQAQRRDVPPFKIFSNRTLIELAEALPLYPDEFQGIFGLTHHVIRRHGYKLIRTIKRGMRAGPPGPPPRRVRPADIILARFDALRAWRKQRAAQRGVESDVIISKKALWELANQDPKTAADLETIKALGNWQRDHYGRELLQVLSQMRNQK